MTSPMPDSSGSLSSMRVSTPSVTTSMRVSGPTRVSPLHAVPDGAADRLVQFVGHAPGDGAGGHPARFQQHDFPPAKPRFPQQSKGNPRRFSRSRRRHEQGRFAGPHRFRQFGQCPVDRQRPFERHGSPDPFRTCFKKAFRLSFLVTRLLSMIK